MESLDNPRSYETNHVDDYLLSAIAECEEGEISLSELMDTIGEAYECGDIDQETYDDLMGRYG